MTRVEDDPPSIGEVWIYNKRKVIITGGQYYSNGRISNHWSFNYIREDGFVTNESGNDYDNNRKKFYPYIGEYTKVTKVIFE
jgi:hypothetical protein